MKLCGATPSLLFELPAVALIAILFLASPGVAADEKYAAADATEQTAIRAAFEAHKVRDKAELARLGKLAAAKKITLEQREQLRKLKAAKEPELDEVDWDKGSVGRLLDASFVRKIDESKIEIRITKQVYYSRNGEAPVRGPLSTRHAVLIGYDSTSLAPSDPIRDVVVMLDKFDGTTAVFRVLDVASYHAKSGTAK